MSEEKGNPYSDDFPELVIIDSRKVIESSVSQSLRSLEKVGTDGYKKFKNNVITDRILNINEPIKRNNLPLPKNPRLTVKSKQSGKVRYLQCNLEVFGSLYMSHRPSDLDEFFCHEIGPFPPSISDYGKMHLTSSKSDLLQCLALKEGAAQVPPKSFDCVVLDGAAVVHFSSPSESQKTFHDYSKKQFVPCIENLLQTCDKVDVVFDQYLPNSLKCATREKRGSGVRQKVEAKVKIPKKWKDFLLVDENKAELFKFLAVETSQHKFKENKQCQQVHMKRLIQESSYTSWMPLKKGTTVS